MVNSTADRFQQQAIWRTKWVASALNFPAMGHIYFYFALTHALRAFLKPKFCDMILSILERC
jgi:hypothetical protein